MVLSLVCCPPPPSPQAQLQDVQRTVQLRIRNGERELEESQQTLESLKVRGEGKRGEEGVGEGRGNSGCCCS